MALTRLSFPSLFMTAAVLAVAAIALPALGGPLVLDSVKLHVLEPLLARHGQLAVFHTPGFGDSMGGLNRIVAMASFVLTMQLDGELSAFSLKLTNFVLHAATGLLAFGLTRRLLGATSWAHSAGVVAACAAGLWLLSPVNFNVAAYAVQRMAQLAALFTFAGLWLYAAGRLSGDAARGRTLIALSVACLPLAVLSKPNGALLVPLAFLVEVWFLHPARPRWTARQLAFAGAAGATAGLVLLIYLYPGALNYQFRDFTLVERLLSQPRALLSYLQHLVLPVGADTAVYSDDFAVSTGLLSPPSTVLALLACAVAAVFCVLGHGRGPAGLAAFGLAFFGVGHALESSFLPLELYFLHRNYLPAYGIYFAIAALLATGLPNRRLALILLSIYAVYFGVVSHARSLTWSSRDNIVAAAVHHHPGSVRALSDYTQVALERGNLRGALAAVNRAIEIENAANSHLQRLYVLCRAGSGIPVAAYAGLREAGSFGVAQELSQAQDNLLRLYQAGGCSPLQVGKLVAALDALAPLYRDRGGNPWTIEYYAAAFLHAAGSEDQALRRLGDRLAGGHLESGLYRLELLIADGRAQAAASTLDYITGRFGAQRLSRYADTIERFRQEVAALSAARKGTE